MTETTSATGCYRVKREGGKGWHWVAPDRYDPKVDVLVDPLDHDADGARSRSNSGVSAKAPKRKAAGATARSSRRKMTSLDVEVGGADGAG